MLVGAAPDPEPGGPPERAANRIARVNVRLEGEMLELTSQRERTRGLVTTIYQLLDRPGLLAISDQLRRAVAALPAPLGSARLPLTGARVTAMGAVTAIGSDVVQVADLWEDELGALDARITGWLIAVEDRATTIALRRLRSSREDVVKERDRYLTRLPPADPLARDLPLRGGRLAPAAAELRSFLQEVARLRIDARAALAEMNQVLQRTVPPHTEVLLARNAVLQKVAVVHRYIAEAARTSPLLYWIVDWAADPVIDQARGGGPDEILYDRIAAALRECWNSAWIVQDRLGATPARTTAKDERGTPEGRVGGTVDDVGKAGPWRFATVVQQAVAELGWAGPTPQAAAVARVMEAAGETWDRSFGFAAGSFALSMAVHTIIPPAGLAVDLVIAGVEVLAAMCRYSERAQEYPAILDQRHSLIQPPSGQDLAAAVIGMMVAPIDGAAGVLANLLPVHIATWTPTGEETRL
ncbi:hypothetical protein [Streptosporangium sp. NPDC001681]|uniref:hypothetical protein n=1 Tax=Streptosporangium sp. NPDC001681 TaxID=3154395 RepID=UPI00332D0A5E